MSIAFPLSLDAFWSWLPVESATPHLQAQQETSSQGSGHIIAAELSWPLWRASVSLGPMTRDEERRASSLLDALDGSINTFLFSPKANPYPHDDPGGVILGASATAIAEIGSDNKSIAINGLPEDYQLRAGDFLSFVVAGRHCLHRLVEDGTADETGVTPLIELRPHLRPGASAGAAIKLVDPVCEMRITPGSREAGVRRGAVLGGVQFAVVQYL